MKTAIAAVALSLLLAACGGGGDSPQQQPAAPAPAASAPVVPSGPPPETGPRSDLPALPSGAALRWPVAAFGDSMTYVMAPALQSALAVDVLNAGVGSTTSGEIGAALAAYPDKLRNVTIWAGHNTTGPADVVLADVAAMVASLPHDRFVVLGLVLADLPGERIGGADRARKLAINAALAAAYPAHYIDTPTLLAAWGNPRNPQDVADAAAGVTPSSLRAFSDALHLNASGARVVAGAVVALMRDSDW